MIFVASIVEGHGEVLALPVLLRRLANWQTPSVAAQILSPIRVRKDRFLNRADEFSRHLQLAAAKCGEEGWILVLLDADDECPASRAAEILRSGRNIIPHRRLAVVLANREFEAWFIASAASLDGVRNFQCQPEDVHQSAETPRNAKGWLGERMGGLGYHETADQAAFAARMDLDAAHARSRSFRKLCSEWVRNMSAAS